MIVFTFVAQCVAAPATAEKPSKKAPPKKRAVTKPKAAATSSKVKVREQEPKEDEDSKSATASDDEGPADDEGGESELEEDAAAASKRWLQLSEYKCPSPLTKYSVQPQPCRTSNGLTSRGGGKLATSTLCLPYLCESRSVVTRVPYAALAKVFSLIEATTKRLEKTALLTSFLLLVIRRSGPGDFQPLLQAVYLCINRVWLLRLVP